MGCKNFKATIPNSHPNKVIERSFSNFTQVQGFLPLGCYTPCNLVPSSFSIISTEFLFDDDDTNNSRLSHPPSATSNTVKWGQSLCSLLYDSS